MEPEEQVPILQPDEKLFKRLNILIEHFRSTYNVKPSFFVRVPGRYIFLNFIINVQVNCKICYYIQTAK